MNRKIIWYDSYFLKGCILLIMIGILIIGWNWNKDTQKNILTLFPALLFVAFAMWISFYVGRVVMDRNFIEGLRWPQLIWTRDKTYLPEAEIIEEKVMGVFDTIEIRRKGEREGIKICRYAYKKTTYDAIKDILKSQGASYRVL